MRAVAALLLSLVLAGCAGRELLVHRGGTPPRDVDFSGQWVLLDRNAETARQLRDAGRDGTISSRRRARGGESPLVYVFLEHGKRLKITQTADGLFISFDRSVVEEYRFGEYRQVSVGPVTADRSSGFDGGAYVIETLDSEGNRLLDRYELIDDGRVLSRRITVYRKNQIDLSVVQTFERA